MYRMKRVVAIVLLLLVVGIGTPHVSANEGPTETPGYTSTQKGPTETPGFSSPAEEEGPTETPGYFEGILISLFSSLIP